MNRKLTFFGLLLVALVPLKSLCAQSSLEISLSYPENIISLGIKEGSSNVSINASYQYGQGRYFFTTQSSLDSNPYVALSTDLLVDQLNIIAKPYKKDPKIAALIARQNKETVTRQKKDLENLKSIAEILYHLDADNPIRSEIEDELKKLEALYYDQ